MTRAGRLLALFTAENPSWGVTEIAMAIGMPKSSTHLLAGSLEEIGMLRRGSDRRYRLGWRIVRLHRSLLDASELYDAARPVLRGVRQRVGCVIAVVVEAGGRADVLLAEGPAAAPSAPAAALATGRPVPAGLWIGAAPIHSRSGAVVGAVDVSAGSGSRTVRARLTPEHLRRVAASAAAEISAVLRAPEQVGRPHRFVGDRIPRPLALDAADGA